MTDSKRDIFLCHASEDKPNIAKPLINAFDEAGITYWYDEAEIRWGDSITQKVNEGLGISRYVVVILSEAFISKNWPQRELNSALNIEASSGEVRILPLLVGSEDIKKRIIEKYPLLNDKLHLPWDYNPNSIVSALQARLQHTQQFVQNKPPNFSPRTYDIPLPRVRKNITQREKDTFLKEAFDFIKHYFQNALGQLQTSYSQVETDLTEIHRFKFLVTIYVHGETINKCKIWIGGPFSSNSIAYQEGNHNIDSDNSCNDWLSISEKENKLGLEASGMFFGASHFEKGTLLSLEKAGEYLWRRFTERLQY